MYRRSSRVNSRSPEQLFGLQEDEKLIPEERVAISDGKYSVKFRETYKDIPIMNTFVVVKEDKDHDITEVLQGNLVEHINDDLGSSVNATISGQDALQIAAQSEGDSVEDVEFDEQVDAKLNIYMMPSEDGKDHKSVPLLAYFICYLVESDAKTSRPCYLINAQTGSVITHWQGIANGNILQQGYGIQGYGGNLKTGLYTFGIDFGLLNTTKVSPFKCAYENEKVKVVHLYGKTKGDKTLVVDCAEGALDEANGAFSPASDAFYFADVFYKMFSEDYLVQPLRGEKIVLKVHYGKNVQNAFWNGKSVLLGDGGNALYPFATVETVGHEIAHGFTEKHSNLFYVGQSGGINEAFSDITGEVLEGYTRNGADWVVGKDLFKVGSGYRWLNNPKNDNVSINHLECFYPGMDVHFSSGLFNRAFFLISSKPSWNITKAFRVFLHANQLYWSQNASFAAAACGVEQAARDMGLSAEDVAEAFKVVGVTPCKEEPSVWQKLWTRSKLVSQTSRFNWTIPNGAVDVKLQVTGQAALYVRIGSFPSVAMHDYVAEGHDPTIAVSNPSAGDWYILVQGRSEYGVLGEIKGSFEAPSIGNSLRVVATFRDKYKAREKENPSSVFNNVMIYEWVRTHVPTNMLTVEVYPKQSNPNPTTQYMVFAKPSIAKAGLTGKGKGYFAMKVCYLQPGNYTFGIKVLGPFNASDWTVKVRSITTIVPV